MEHKKSFSVGSSLRFGWTQFKTHAWFLIGMTLFTVAVSLLVGSISDEHSMFGSTIGSLLSMAISILITISWRTVSLRYANNQLVAFKDFFSRYDIFWKYLGASIVYFLIVIGGLILLIVPGIIWAIKYQMYGYLIIDKGMGIKESLRESGKLTKGVRGKLLWFAIVCGAVNLLGMILFGVGLLVTMPLVMIAAAHVYTRLKNTEIATERASEPEPEHVEAERVVES